MLGIDITVLIRADDDTAVAVVQKVFQRIIKTIEGHKRADLFLFDGDGRLFEKRQHRTLAFGEMFPRGAVRADGSEHAREQIELIGNKGIDLLKILQARVQLFLYTVVKDDEVFDDRRLLLVAKGERLLCRRRLFEDPLFDDRIDVGRGQGKTRIKPPLDLGKVVPLYLGDRVDILLAGDDEPCLPLAFFAELFADGLQIEHEVGIVADILADLIDQKDDMMIFSFFLNVRLYALGEVFNADGILPRRLFTPVAGSRIAHKTDRRERIDDGILNKIEILPRIFPSIAVFLQECRLECLIPAFVRQTAFQIGKIGHRSAKALHLVEYLQKDAYDRIFVALSVRIALGIDVEQDDIGRRGGSKLHIRQDHLVFDLMIVDKIVDGIFFSNLFIGEQIGKDLQKVRFTTTEKARDPYTRLCRRPVDPLLIGGKKIGKVLLQLPRHHILFELLHDICLFALSDDDDPLQITVYLFCK